MSVAGARMALNNALLKRRGSVLGAAALIQQLMKVVRRYKHKRIQFVRVNNKLSYADAAALCEESTRNNNYNTDIHEV